jgi:hypothetical protein
VIGRRVVNADDPTATTGRPRGCQLIDSRAKLNHRAAIMLDAQLRQRKRAATVMRTAAAGRKLFFGTAAAASMSVDLRRARLWRDGVQTRAPLARGEAHGSNVETRAKFGQPMERVAATLTR